MDGVHFSDDVYHQFARTDSTNRLSSNSARSQKRKDTEKRQGRRSAPNETRKETRVDQRIHSSSGNKLVKPHSARAGGGGGRHSGGRDVSQRLIELQASSTLRRVCHGRPNSSLRRAAGVFNDGRGYALGAAKDVHYTNNRVDYMHLQSAMA